jgi:hypothetical protein
MKVRTLGLSKESYFEIIQSIQYYQAKCPRFIQVIIGYFIKGMYWFANPF